METKSFKQMIQAGEVKRADAMKVRLDDIHEEPGFNLRDEGEDLAASIEALADYIMGGGIYPALEVRPRAGGGVYLVDGHRRRRALLLARERGAPIEWVEVRAFVGNDADRVARIITSAEGRELKPLEVARGYKRLAAFGLTADDIAKRVGKTRQHVDQLMILANANTDVQQLVAAGGVSAAVAVKMARQHGEGAGQVLQQELDKAKAAGKAKVTEGTMKPKALPAKVVQGIVEELDAFVEVLPKDARERLAAIESAAKAGQLPDGQMVSVPAAALLSLLGEHSNVVDARKDQERKAREKANRAAQGVLG